MPNSVLHFVSIRILLVCTANMCRSPMAQAILSGLLAQRGIAAEVISAGLLQAGQPMAPEAFDALGGEGAAMGSYRSRSLVAEDGSWADLVLGMAREHVREVVVLVPEAWGYTFTLKELVRRGEVHGPRGPGQPLRSWLAEVSVDRQRSDLLGAATVDDVADPMGGPPGRFAETAAELRDLCRRLVDLLGT
jgi:protein-tyrosine phosphatase